MTHSYRLASFSILGLLVACSSTDLDVTSGPGAGSGGTPGAAGATSGGGTTATGGAGTTTGGTGGAGATTGATGGVTGGAAGTGGAGAGGVDTGGGDTGGGDTGGAGAGGGDTGGGGTGGPTPVGDLHITDPVPGFASVAGGTTGGGTDLSSAITVDSMSELQDAAKGATPAIILVKPGNYSGTLAPGANKTIIGVGPGVTIAGNIRMSGADVHNIIIRNLAVRGARCASYDECKSGADAVYTGNGAHHVWLDHLDISDGQDGNCDITQGADYVTVSWARFYYTYDKEHRFSNLIAGSDDEPASVGKLHITYMNSHWGERVDSRQPRGRYGNVHMLNNYHKTGGGQIHGVGKDMALIAENCVYDENRSIWTDMGSPRGWKGIGNQGTGDDLNDSRGTVFEIPYRYTPMPASQVVAAVTSKECGAGNTCTLAY
ncbi:pectate lyase family protein [Sorangium sp. So ce381]|uniref:pectate lyase family protein n=1 Tax=Sorangium sp. So ce381 TaxID=3133307 RepID=UPI003F5BDDBE